MDEAAQAELDAIRGNLAKYKGKYGKDIGIDELDWVGGCVRPFIVFNASVCRRIRTRGSKLSPSSSMKHLCRKLFYQ